MANPDEATPMSEPRVPPTPQENDSEPPTLMSLRGIAPNLTGGLSSEDFVRDVRARHEAAYEAALAAYESFDDIHEHRMLKAISAALEVVARGGSPAEEPWIGVCPTHGDYHAREDVFGCPECWSETSPTGGPAEPSEAAAEAFLVAHYRDAPSSKAGLRMYPHKERIEYVRTWLRAAYAVDRAGPALSETPFALDEAQFLWGGSAPDPWQVALRKIQSMTGGFAHGSWESTICAIATKALSVERFGGSAGAATEAALRRALQHITDFEECEFNGMDKGCPADTMRGIARMALASAPPPERHPECRCPYICGVHMGAPPPERGSSPGIVPEVMIRLQKAAEIIERADARCLAVDGPVGHVREEMTDAEWRELYLLVSGAGDAGR